MSSLFESTSLATEKNRKSIKQASDILLNYFNLNNFYYYKITESGDFFLFDDNQGVIDFLDSHEFILKHSHYCHPKYHHDSFKIERTVNNPLLVGLEETQDYFMRSKFNLSVSIVDRTDNAVEEFGFHSPVSSEEQSLFICNHLNEIKFFTKWFLENNHSLFAFLHESRINLPRLLGDVFFSDRIQAEDPDRIKREAFLKELGIQKNADLSPTDIEVLKLTLKGFSPSQIGHQIYRSKRTVEHRIESIKQKLSCCSKVELIQKAQELEQWQYLLTP